MRISQNNQNKRHKSQVVFLFVWIFSSGFFMRAQAQQVTYATITEKVTIPYKAAMADRLLADLDQQTSYDFVFQEEVFNKIPVSGFQFTNTTLGNVLDYLGRETGMLFSVNNKTIAVKKSDAAQQKQSGRLSGRIVDAENGQPVAGATIRVGNTGTTSDGDGAYSLSLPEGKYTATISYIGYGTKEITGIEIKSRQTFELSIVLKRGKGSLAAVVVSASARKESVAALYLKQKNAAGITDGISQEQISRTPDKNIGETLKRISGLSTMDNKYVTVRGLSERYNGAALNGQLLPSTELNRKQFSFDIIPSNMVDNVTVYKTLTPDMNAEFGGGLVQVNTKEIPVENFTTVTIGGSYNDQTTGKDFKSSKMETRQYFGQVPQSRYMLGKLDWKNRDEILQSGNFDPFPNSTLAAGGIMKDPGKFVNNWLPYNYKAGISPNLQVSVGRVKALANDQKIGFIASGSYRHTWQTQYIRMSRDGFEGSMEKGELYAFDGTRYGFTSNMAGLAGAGYSNRHTRIGIQTLYQLTYDQQLLLGGAINNGRANLATDGYYDVTRQTALWQNQLKGEHRMGSKGVKLNWMLSYTYLNRHNPDNHFMQFTELNLGKDNQYETTDFSITEAASNGINAGVLRNWSRAYEKNFGWNQDLSIPFRFTVGQTAASNVFKIGYAGWTKKRVFWVLNTGTVLENGFKGPQPISEVYNPLINKLRVEASSFGDDFDRNASLHAVYGMMDNRLGKHLRLVWGVRAEYYNMNKANPIIDAFIKNNSGYGHDIDYSVLLDKEPNWNLFPSANLTYSLTPAMNIRLAYSKSIVRPDLREMTNFRQYDFELGGEYTSNAPVLSTRISNYDFRYEWYPGAGEVLAVSLFYKKIKYPMEIYKEGDNRSYFLRNNASAENKGIEVEARKSFAFTKIPVIKNITLSGNFTRLFATVVPMSIQYTFPPGPPPTKMVMTEVTGPKENRPQAGASNYIGNAAIYYDTQPFSLSLNYNYVSNRTFRTANVYATGLFERPLNALDGQLVVRVLKQKAEIKLNISNLLNTSSIIYANYYADIDADGKPVFPLSVPLNGRAPTTKELLYDKGIDQMDYEARPGRTYSLGFSYKF